jgi:hypothetical protein
MGILILFVFVVLCLFATLGAFILYQIGYWIGLKWLHLPLPSRWLWALVCLTTYLVNLYGLLFLLNDSKGDMPNPSIIWKYLMGISLIVSVVTYFLGIKLIKH